MIFIEYKHNKEIVNLAKNLRNNMTKEEKHLWYDFLKNHTIKFTRQKVFGNYILDFYCSKAKLAIEVDGAQHYDEKGRKYDLERTAFLSKYDVTVIRILNNDINDNFNAVCRYIDSFLEQLIEK